jgi:type IV secretory pathway VirB2 component (pilin)
MKIVNKILFTMLSFFLATPVFAQEDEPPRLGEGIDLIIGNVAKYIFPAAGLVCVVFIIIGGYTWIASAGDPAKVQQAQGTLTWAIIGLVFVLIAALIVNSVTSFFD